MALVQVASRDLWCMFIISRCEQDSWQYCPIHGMYSLIVFDPWSIKLEICIVVTTKSSLYGHDQIIHVLHCRHILIGVPIRDITGVSLCRNPCRMIVVCTMYGLLQESAIQGVFKGYCLDRIRDLLR